MIEAGCFGDGDLSLDIAGVQVRGAIAEVFPD